MIKGDIETMSPFVWKGGWLLSQNFMKAIRINLYQSIANYKKEETSLNKMTYPLPPFSTIIGAIHNACKWDTYHYLKIGLLGNYGSIENRAYRNNSFLDNTMDDRDVLVKCPNPNSLSATATIVAISDKKRGSLKKNKETSDKKGSSFKNNIDIIIKNKKLYEEYIQLDKFLEELKSETQEKIIPITKRLNEIKDKKSLLDKTSSEFKTLFEEEVSLKEQKKTIEKEKKNKENNILQKKSLYKTLNPSLKYYELLTEVHLIVYIVTENEQDMKDIMDNVYNITAIGRAEDSVNVSKIDVVNLKESDDEEYSSLKGYNQYIDYNYLKEEYILRNFQSKHKNDTGTIYYVPKDYCIVDNKRIFNKKKVVLCSDFMIDNHIPDVYIDSEISAVINLF